MLFNKLNKLLAPVIECMELALTETVMNVDNFTVTAYGRNHYRLSGYRYHTLLGKFVDFHRIKSPLPPNVDMLGSFSIIMLHNVVF